MRSSNAYSNHKHTKRSFGTRRTLVDRRCRIFLALTCVSTLISGLLSLFNRAAVERIKELAIVVTLDFRENATQPNRGRLKAFMKMWGDTCTAKRSLRVEKFEGLTHARRGEGLTQTFINVLSYAERSGADILYVFEDDATILNDVFCDERFRFRMWRSVPDDTLALIFAAHHANFFGPYSTLLRHQLTLRPVAQSLGSYAWSLRRSRFKLLRARFEDHVRSGAVALSPDIILSRYVAGSPYRSYLLTYPNLFHHGAGYSNTWKIQREAVADTGNVDLLYLCKSAAYRNMFELLFDQNNCCSEIESYLNLSSRFANGFVLTDSNANVRDCNGQISSWASQRENSITYMQGTTLEDIRKVLRFADAEHVLVVQRSSGAYQMLTPESFDLLDKFHLKWPYGVVGNWKTARKGRIEFWKDLNYFMISSGVMRRDDFNWTALIYCVERFAVPEVEQLDGTDHFGPTRLLWLENTYDQC